ncbi:MAG: NUDIX hydrolase [Alphaproteobacteria bacterium]
MTSDADHILGKVKSGLLPLDIADRTDHVQREGQRRAAVLMPLVMRGSWQVILTQRPETMPHHPGQISFPGGKVEAGETARGAVLRETEEEIGVKPEAIELLGRLPSFNAVSQFRVTPFIGIVDPDVPILPDPYEVADAFETPLSFLMDAANHTPRDITIDDTPHRLWDMPYTGADGVYRNIWGMTAMMMYRLYERGFKA